MTATSNEDNLREIAGLRKFDDATESRIPVRAILDDPDPIGSRIALRSASDTGEV